MKPLSPYLLGLGILLSTVVPARSLPTNTVESEQAIKALVNLLNRGRFDQVDRHSQSLLSAVPTAPVKDLVAIALLFSGRLDEGEQAYQAAQSMGHNSYLLLANAVLLQVKGAEGAMAAAQNALQQGPNQPLAHYNLGRLHYTGQAYGAAAQSFALAIQLEPQLTIAHTALGTVHLAEGDLGAALKAFVQAVSSDSLDPRPYIGLTNTYAQLGQAKLALQAGEKALALAPGQKKFHLGLGALYLEGGQSNKALNAARIALNANLDLATAHLLAGQAHANLNQLDSARTHFTQLTKVAPDRVEGHLLSGFALLEAAALRQAKARFEQAAKIKPNLADPYLGLGVAAHLDGREALAQEHWQRALELGPNAIRPLGHFLMANISHEQGKIEQTHTHLQQATNFVAGFQSEGLKLAKGPSPTTAQTNLSALFLNLGWVGASIAACDTTCANHSLGPFIKARALRAKGDYHGAIVHLRKTLEIFPQYAVGQTDLAALLASNNQLEEAVKVYRSILQHKPEEAYIHLLLAKTYQTLDQVDNAVAHYQKAITYAPQSAAAHNDFAYYLAQQLVDLPLAHKLALRAMELAPGNSGVFDTLGWVYYKMGQYQKALKALEKAIEELPQVPSVHYHLGMVYHRLGKDKNAMKHLGRSLTLASNFPEAQAAQKTLAKLQRP